MIKNIDVYEFQFFLLASIGILSLLVIFIIIVIVQYARSQKQFIVEQARKEAEFKLELQHVQNEILENLMKQVYSEIHDNLGQQAAVLKLQLYGIEKHKNPEAASLAIDTLSKLIGDMKTLSVSFNPDVMKAKSICEAVRFELDRIEKTGLIEVQADIETVGDINSDISLVLYRIAQELIQNILKHSHATKIYAQIKEVGNEVHFAFKDNGIGIEASRKAGSVSTGLQNLRKRCELIGCTLKIDSDSGGTLVKIIYFR